MLNPTTALGKSNWVGPVGLSDFMLIPNAVDVGCCEEGTSCTVSLRWPVTRNSFKTLGERV